MTFHHLGLAVRAPRRAVEFLMSMGYEIDEPVLDMHQGVNLQMARNSRMPDVEIIWPGEGMSPIDAILERVDGGVYHTCYTTTSIADSLSSMESDGIRHRVVADAAPAPLFGGQHVLFLQVVGFGLVELLEV